MAETTISSSDLAQLQTQQFRHDQRNHSDIACLPKPDRLKHYGLHFAKYVGRLARGASEGMSIDRTVVDTALICLSAANTLHQRLSECAPVSRKYDLQIDQMLPFADAAGRFADACEKIDHLEEFLPIARTANEEILQWTLSIASQRNLDLMAGIRDRRRQLAERQFYIAD